MVDNVVDAPATGGGKTLDNMSPQEVFEQFSQGKATFDDYCGSLERASVEDFAHQANNIQVVFETFANTHNDSSDETVRAAARKNMDKLVSIYNNKVNQSEKYQSLMNEPGVASDIEKVVAAQVAENPIPQMAESLTDKQTAAPQVPPTPKVPPVAESPEVPPATETPKVEPVEIDPASTAEVLAAQEIVQPENVTIATAPAENAGVTQAVENPDIDLMVNKINYMNRRNHAVEGSERYVDPQETAQKMYALYGENASTLLNEALMAPNNVNDKGKELGNPVISEDRQTLSREAVNYLANLSPEQAKEYANHVFAPAALAQGNEQGHEAPSPATEQSRQAALKENLTDIKEKNPAQFADLQTAIDEIANGGDFDQVFAKLIIKMLNGAENADPSASIEQMLTNAGYANTQEGKAEFVRDAQAAFQEIGDTRANGNTQQGPKLDEYGYVIGSEEAKQHDKDMQTYRELYGKDPKKFQKAKEGYEKAAESGELAGQAKYYLKVIEAVEKEEKTKEQMLKDSKKAAKHIEKLDKKIAKLEKKIEKNKGNKEKVDELAAELQKLQKEKAKEMEKIAGQNGKEAEGKDGKKDGVKEATGITTGKDGQGKDGPETPAAATVQKTTTGNNVIYKIVKDGEERSVNVQLDDQKRIVGMSFRNGENLMTQGEANQFMMELKADPNVDQNNITVIEKFKQLDETRGTGAIKYAAPKIDGSEQTITPSNTLTHLAGGNSRGDGR